MNKIIRYLIPNRYCRITLSRYYHEIPFFDFYEKFTGDIVSQDFIKTLKKRHPSIISLSTDHLHCTLEILTKFGIAPDDACRAPHIFCMNPITMDNYGEILKECGFTYILPQHIIKYHTIVKKTTIKKLKTQGLLEKDLNLIDKIQSKIKKWPTKDIKILKQFDDENSSILNIRMYILENYLKWTLSITSDDFEKYCKIYLPLQHKPMSDIQETIHIALNEIKIDKELIRRNGFILAIDPVNAKLILENVPTLAGLRIHDVLRACPAIMKNNYHNLLEISKILKEYNIPEQTQQRSLRVFCMKPETVKCRLEELKDTKQFQLFASNPRVLFLVVHKDKMAARVDKIRSANMQAFRLTHLVSSKKAFNNYLDSIGRRVSGNDVVLLIYNSLYPATTISKAERKDVMTRIKNELKKHKYWAHAAMDVVDENLRYLKCYFPAEDIVRNCQLLLYPLSKVQEHVTLLLDKRNDLHVSRAVNYTQISNSQILSLVLYEIEKNHHFTGDGMWIKEDLYKQASYISSI